MRAVPGIEPIDHIEITDKKGGFWVLFSHLFFVALPLRFLFISTGICGCLLGAPRMSPPPVEMGQGGEVRRRRLS